MLQSLRLQRVGHNFVTEQQHEYIILDAMEKPGQTFWQIQYQFSSVAQSGLTLCSPMDCSTLGLLVHHQFLEFIQIHIHSVGDSIQSLHPLSSPSPPAFNLSQHQVFSNESVLPIRWPKYCSVQSNVVIPK